MSNANVKQYIAELLMPAIGGEIKEQAVMDLLEYPPDPQMGDLSLPCFKLSKTMRKAPQAIAEQLRQVIATGGLIARTEAVSGYLNFYFDKGRFAKAVLQDVLFGKKPYGSNELGRGKNVVIDYSSPNIAKPFHIGHLRSTVIGNALANIFRFSGYKVTGVNHLGDWGTQFGKLIVAYMRWGSEAQVKAEGVGELLRLYVKFHDEAEKDPSLEDEAREWFVRLEKNDERALKLWRWFIDISMREFGKIYDLLGVTFDSYAGESFYNDKMDTVIAELAEKGLLEEDQGAMLVRLDDYGMPPALMLKKDGGSLYHTRDVAAAIYRKQTYDFDQCIYVTDYAQNLHFQQWFKIVELMGYPWADKLVHVAFGRVSLEGVRLATRKGNVVMLEDLLKQAIAKTREIIESKNPHLPNKDEVARQVGVGAVIFNDLSMNRIKDIAFSWDEALNFDGETGPYVQYTHARACSVLRKAESDGELVIAHEAIAVEQLQDAEAQRVLKELYLFPERVEMAMRKYEPSVISRYLIDLSQSFNRFYHERPILLADQPVRTARLALVKAVQTVLKTGLNLIGLETPEKI
ncbi:MAG TPA: arginine--tRNA ligase [Bacilli bacterium]